MIVRPNGSRVGSISGGCLEADVAARAASVIETGLPEYVVYDARNENGDVVAELGCKGAVGVLIERVSDSRVAESVIFLDGFRNNRGTGVHGVVFRVEGESGHRIGDRFLHRDGQPPHGALAGAEIEPLLQDCIREVRANNTAGNYRIGHGNASIDLMLEPLRSPTHLVMFGAGQDAPPLAHAAALLGWLVTVIDQRRSLLAAERFPSANLVFLNDAKALQSTITFDDGTAAVVMSHSYAQDLFWLRELAQIELPYIGLLGPRRRTEQLIHDLRKEGVLISDTFPDRIFSPAGLDIGSETAQEIAAAIVAEIHAVAHRRNGGFLRNRPPRVHSEFYSPLPEASGVDYSGTGCKIGVGTQ